eukprot:SAG11_NODE_20008_length_454_cov_1.459155_1_plen_44_part_10
MILHSFVTLVFELVCFVQGVFYPPTADEADWDCGDTSEAHSCNA